jgi:hypothetical protein
MSAVDVSARGRCGIAPPEVSCASPPLEPPGAYLYVDRSGAAVLDQVNPVAVRKPVCANSAALDELDPIAVRVADEAEP